ncbi:SIS domain-containing protein [Flexivirga endophytica]|uniref:SIS domain-containing protein n=1 Tax=Flexivirga endophytica TaxID=1849103 RepID=UPI00166D5D77|nr:SIS domain-containing protein [Flexivirga endophytica]
MRAALAQPELPQWEESDRIVVVAMGASTNAGDALVAALRARGITAVNANAADIAHAPAGYLSGAQFVLVSESGRSPEPLAAAERLPSGRRIAITNDPGAPLAGAVDAVLPLGGWDDSRVYTTGFTATLLTFALLLRHQFGSDVAPDPATGVQLVRELTERRVPEVKRAAAILGSAGALDVVGSGLSLSAAAEGALMVREGARLHATAYDTYQYIHGPMESLNRQSGLVILGDGRELGVVDMTLEREVPTVLLTCADPAGLPREADSRGVVLSLPENARGLNRTVAETVLLQQLVGELTANLGLDIDEFLYNQPDTKVAKSEVP